MNADEEFLFKIRNYRVILMRSHPHPVFGIFNRLFPPVVCIHPDAESYGTKHYLSFRGYVWSDKLEPYFK